MTDIFDEVGDDLRRDRMKRLWQAYGVYVIALAVLVVLATAGWRGWEAWSEARSAAAGDAFQAALKKAGEGDPKAAAEALTAFASDAPADYARIARFRIASEHAVAGETDNALAAFESLAADGAAPAALRDLARVRAAMIAVDKEDLAAIRTRVGAFNTDISPWRHAARELIALAAIKAAAWQDARAELDKLIADPAVPPEARARAQILQAVVVSAVGEPAKPAQAGS